MRHLDVFFLVQIFKIFDKLNISDDFSEKFKKNIYKYLCDKYFFKRSKWGMSIDQFLQIQLTRKVSLYWNHLNIYLLIRVITHLKYFLCFDSDICINDNCWPNTRSNNVLILGLYLKMYIFKNIDSRLSFSNFLNKVFYLNLFHFLITFAIPMNVFVYINRILFQQ